MKYSRNITVEYTLLGFLVASTLLSAVDCQGQVTLNPLYDSCTGTEALESDSGDASYLKVTITEAYTTFIWMKFNLSAVPEAPELPQPTLSFTPM